MTKILVTGGSGELGSSLVPRLREAGYTVRIMSRRPAPLELGDGVEWATADLATGMGLAEAVVGVTEIIHAASQPFKQTQAIDVEGTVRLTQAAKTASVEHFFYISIVGVDRIPTSYYKHKVAAEKIVEASGLNWSILRAGQFHSFIDTLTGSLARLPIMFVPTDFCFQSMATGEVADHIVAGLQRGLRGQWPDLAGPQQLRWGEIAQQWLTARGEARRIVRLPIPGRLAAALRAGYNTVPERPSGTITWEAWLNGERHSEVEGGLVR
jgi:uncharacterized protein YbjT (DUF2867 family)